MRPKELRPSDHSKILFEFIRKSTHDLKCCVLLSNIHGDLDSLYILGRSSWDGIHELVQYVGSLIDAVFGQG